MSWVSEKQHSFEEVFALRENLYQDFLTFEGVFGQHNLLPSRLMQLCRLRCAQLHRCVAEQDTLSRQLPGSAVEALPHWYTDGQFSSLEKAALQLAECFTLDPHSISDAMTAAVVTEIGDAGLVALFEYLALCDGFIRFQVILQTGEAA